MVGKADSPGFSMDKKSATQTFIYYVEQGAADATLVKITKDLGMGFKDGVQSAESESNTRQWCKYRSGGGSWPLDKLEKYVERALTCKYILEWEAKEINNKILIAKNTYEYEKSEHVNLERLRGIVKFGSDIERTKETLMQQILQLPGRIEYGCDELEKIHYYTLAINYLSEIKALIDCLQGAKKKEEKKLKDQYGKRNYKEIDIGKISNKFFDDAKYTAGWWEMPMQTSKVSKTNGAEFRRQVWAELDEIKMKLGKSKTRSGRVNTNKLS
jgi:hypothetical protein